VDLDLQQLIHTIRGGSRDIGCGAGRGFMAYRSSRYNEAITPSRKEYGRTHGTQMFRRFLLVWTPICMLSRRTKNRVAAEMGNSPQMVVRHYRAFVKRADCKMFWAIEPVEG
jgi:hypothetical protein